MVAELAVALVLAITAPAPAPADVPQDYTSMTQVEELDATEPAPSYYVTTARITTYCPWCNEPEGHGSASGAYLTAGHCACNWLPIGTTIAIDGEEFTVVDICGTDAIDLFIDDGAGYCHCDMNEYKEVVIYE